MQPNDLAQIVDYYHIPKPEEFVRKTHVFPRYPAAVLVSESGQMILKQMMFGFIPFFEKEEKPKKVFHNARSETLAEKISFKKAFQETRCLVPIQSFFEYIWETENKKWTARFFPKNNELMTAAGLWSKWKSPTGKIIDSFTVITTDPPKFILETGHDRCPLFLNKEGQQEWVSAEKKSVPELKQILSKNENFQFMFEKLNS